MFNQKKHSSVFKIWLIIVEIAYFLLAIIAGSVFTTADIIGREHFNWGLFFLVWASNIPLFAILYAIYSHLDNQETQIKLADKILDELQNTSEPAPKSPLTSIARNIEPKTSADTWKCPKCGDRNKNTALQCSCGYYK